MNYFFLNLQNTLTFSYWEPVDSSVYIRKALQRSTQVVQNRSLE